MSREIPAGWVKVSKYAMKKGVMAICRVYVGGEMLWELYNGDGPAAYRGKDSEGAFDEAIAISKELEKAKK